MKAASGQSCSIQLDNSNENQGEWRFVDSEKHLSSNRSPNRSIKMKGLIVFDNLNDIIYMKCNRSFSRHIHRLAESQGFSCDDVSTKYKIAELQIQPPFKIHSNIHFVIRILMLPIRTWLCSFSPL